MKNQLTLTWIWIKAIIVKVLCMSYAAYAEIKNVWHSWVDFSTAMNEILANVGKR